MLSWESTQIHIFKTVQEHRIRPHLEIESSQGCLRPNKSVSVDLNHHDCVLTTHRGKTGEDSSSGKGELPQETQPCHSLALDFQLQDPGGSEPGRRSLQPRDIGTTLPRC